MTVAKELAYAKINLYLDVLSKREDGFHNIKTIMHSVSLADEITVLLTPSRMLNVTLSVDGAQHLPNDGRNLACRAAVLFFEKLGKAADVKIKLVKRIPIAAGLAGGSSDAAAVLRALNKIYKKPFTLKSLAKMSSELGSDVPYCVLGKTAFCEGRGEIMIPIKTQISLNAVIVSTDEYVSTPEAYKTLDNIYSDFDGSVSTYGDKYFENIIAALEGTGKIYNGMFNVFEKAILPKCKKAEALKAELLSLGADFSMMSGSGPSVFGVFKTQKMAQNAEQKLKAQGVKAWFVQTV